MSRTKVIDFMVRPHGTVWTFEPQTDAAKGFGVDHRLANDLVAALESEGFVLEM